MKMETSVSVVIPTLNAEAEIDELLNQLELQTVAPSEVIIIDSSSDDCTVEIAKRHSQVRLIEIKRSEFDHGGTRNIGFNESFGDFVLFMTQDAVPTDRLMIENLLYPFVDDRVAIVSGRQLPKEDARLFERLVREFNYPSISNKRTKEDIERLGIKAFFSSDVCCMYRRTSLAKIGGVPSPCSTNEDMLAAARCLKLGMSVCYSAEARVFHSHNLSLRQQFNRNRKIGAFLREHEDEVDVPSEIGEGGKLVHYVASSLTEGREYLELFRFILDCMARYAGNIIGRNE